MDNDVGVLRAFNRSYTQRIGVLVDDFLGRDRPLAESRLLFEIGPDGGAVTSLRDRLGLDSGYTSRLLRNLAAAGLVEVVADPADGRRRRAHLTMAGRAELAELDQRSDDLARDLLAPLGDRHRQRLVAALTDADRLIRSATVTFDPTDPRDPDAEWAIGRYFAELDARFPGGFDPGTDDVSPLTAPRGAFLVARSDGHPVGCGGVQRLPDGPAEIKRMWVADTMRGTGLGRRLLAALEDLAAGLGDGRVRLDSNTALTQAIAMYEATGYRSIARYNDNPHAERWFEKSLR